MYDVQQLIRYQLIVNTVLLFLHFVLLYLHLLTALSFPLRDALNGATDPTIISIIAARTWATDGYYRTHISE